MAEQRCHYDIDGPFIKFPPGILSYPNDASISKCTATTHNDFITGVTSFDLDFFELQHYYASLLGLANFFNRLDISFTGIGIDYQAQRLLLQQEKNNISTEFALQSIAYEPKDFYVTITVKASANDEPRTLPVDVIDNALMLGHPDNTHFYNWMRKGKSQESDYLKARQLIDDLDAFCTIFPRHDNHINPLKGMLIIGPNVALPQDIKDFFQQPQYKLQEGLKEITQKDHPVRAASRPPINEETLFITIGHCNVNDASKSHEIHVLPAKEYARTKLELTTPVIDASETAQTAYYLGHLNLLIDAPVHLHLFSCYGSSACPDVMYMKEQSTLITYSSASKSLLIPIGIHLTRCLLNDFSQNNFSSAQIFYNLLYITPGVDLCFGRHLPGQKLFQYSYLAQNGNAESAAQTFASQFHQEVDSSIEFVRIPLNADKREELSFLNLFYNEEYFESAMVECSHNQGFRQFIRNEWKLAFQTNVLMNFATTANNATTISETIEKIQQGILEGHLAPVLQFGVNSNLLCCADVDFSLKDKYGWNALTFTQVHSMLKSNTDNTDFIQYLIRDAKVDFWTPVTFITEKNSSSLIPPICITNSQPITQILVDEYLHQKIALGEEELKCVAETFKVGLDDLKNAIEEAPQQEICIELKGGLRLNVE